MKAKTDGRRKNGARSKRKSYPIPWLTANIVPIVSIAKSVLIVLIAADVTTAKIALTVSTVTHAPTAKMARTAELVKAVLGV